MATGSIPTKLVVVKQQAHVAYLAISSHQPLLNNLPQHQLIPCITSFALNRRQHTLRDHIL